MAISRNHLEESDLIRNRWQELFRQELIGEKDELIFLNKY